MRCPAVTSPPTCTHRAARACRFCPQSRARRLTRLPDAQYAATGGVGCTACSVGTFAGSSGDQCGWCSAGSQVGQRAPPLHRVSPRRGRVA